MGGRIRTLKPEWLEDQRLSAASPAARVLSVGLILLADDHGNGRAHPSFLVAQVFPTDRDIDIDAAVAELSGWFADLYKVEGQSYFHIRNWERHQKVQHVGKPRVPPPPAAGAVKPARAPKKVAYFARGTVTGLVKIGESLDPVKRVIELAKCGSESLELLAVGGSERELHEQLKSSRVHGEWFRASPEVLQKIREAGGALDKPIFTAAYSGSSRPVADQDSSRDPHESSGDSTEVLTPDLRPHTSDLDQDQETPGQPTAPAAPSPKAKRVKGAKTSCPSIDATDEAIEAWLAAEGLPSLMSEDGTEVERMLDYHRKESKQSGSWKSSWRTWTNNWEAYGRKTFGPARGEPAGDGEMPPLKVRAPAPVFDFDAPDVPMPEDGDFEGVLISLLGPEAKAAS